MGVDWWVSGLLGTLFYHHQQFIVKRCASAKTLCLKGEHHGPNICEQHHPLPTFISLLSHARQRKKTRITVSNIKWCKMQTTRAKYHRHQINKQMLRTRYILSQVRRTSQRVRIYKSTRPKCIFVSCVSFVFFAVIALPTL